MWKHKLWGGRIVLVAAFAVRASGGKGPHGVIPLDYQRDVGPGRVHVSISVVIVKLHSVDPASNIVRLTARIRRTWYDPRLKIDLSSAESVTIDPGSIWTPDVELIERSDEFVEACNEPPAIVFAQRFVDSLSNATERYNLFYSTKCVLALKCKISLVEFPFDVNRCNMTFSPWVDMSYELDPVQGLSYADVITQQFELVMDPQAHRGQRTLHLPGGKTLEFSTVVYGFSLARFDRYYLSCLIMPLLLMVFLAWFTFFTPLNKSDRLAYCVTLVLAAMAVQYITADKRPPEVEDGWIDRFQMFIYMFIIMPILETAVLYRLHGTHERRDEKEIGERKVQMLDRILRMSYPIFITCFIFGFLGPGSPFMKKRHSEASALSVSILIFLFFWVPVTGILFACACWNWCKFGPMKMSDVQEAISITLLDHDHDIQNQSKDDLADESSDDVSDRVWA